MKPVKWGILSTARINRAVIPPAHASEKVELVAVGSRQQARADAYAAEWEIPRAYGSYEALLADDEIEAVYISCRTTSIRSGRSAASKRASTSSARNR